MTIGADTIEGQCMELIANVVDIKNMAVEFNRSPSEDSLSRLAEAVQQSEIELGKLKEKLGSFIELIQATQEEGVILAEETENGYEIKD